MNRSPSKSSTRNIPAGNELNKFESKLQPKFSASKSLNKQPNPTARNIKNDDSNVGLATSSTSNFVPPTPRRFASLNTTGKSKIPTKFSTNASKEVLTNTKETRKEPATPRSLSRCTTRSNSKFSLDGVTNKKLERTPSRASFTSTSTSTTYSAIKSSPQRSPTTRTPRSPLPSGVRRRSASTLSGAPLPAPVSPAPSSIEPKETTETETVAESEEVVPSLPQIRSNSGDQDGNNLSSDRLSLPEVNKIRTFESIEKRLNEIQSEFWKKLSTVQSTSPDQLKSNYKFITIVRNDRSELVVNDGDQLKAPKKLPAYSINDFKEKVKTMVEGCVHDLIENYKNNPSIEDSAVAKLKSKSLSQMNKMVDDLCCVSDPNETNNDAQIVKMQKELQDGHKALRIAEKKMNEERKKHEEKMLELEKAKSDIDGQTKTQINELKKKLHAMETQKNAEQAEKVRLEDELKNTKISLSTLTKKVKDLESQLKNNKDELKQRNNMIDSMAKEIADSAVKMNELKIKHKIGSNQLSQINELKGRITELELAKTALEEQLEASEKECLANQDIERKLNEAENRVAELQKALESNSIESTPQQYKDNQLEMAKLRQSEAEKRREIEKLKIELAKGQCNISQLEEQVQRDQQLLDVRGKLINSLQTNEVGQRVHMNELITQVGEKNNTIDELSNELKVKKEEFRNLFTTISAKQMELSNQEHMIKLLEESNDRSQMLRVKQEEKIGRLEEELAHLKQTISTYQTKVLAHNTTCKNFLFAPVLPSDDSNENFYYHSSHRKRKRQVDINVKKYET